MKQDEPTYPVWERLKLFRTQKGFTVNRLANMAGLSQSHLRDIELGNKNPSVETLHIICQALGVSLKDFFNDDLLESLESDPLLRRIYRLSPEQREALCSFLDPIP